MTKQRYELIKTLLRRGFKMNDAIEKSDGFEIPALAFCESRVIECNGMAVEVFRAGPDNDPWWNLKVL